jgi:integrase
MPQIEQKLDEVLERLARIEKSLKIVPDRNTSVFDFSSSIEQYKKFAKEDLGLQDLTIENQTSIIASFLEYSKGMINKDAVKAYLDTNESPSWKANQLKAIRRYTRDFLKLGNWINDFKFEKVSAKPKIWLPTGEELIQFYNELPYQVQIVFMILHCTGLRLGEVLSLQLRYLDFETNMIDASSLHQGKTKSSWVTFFTSQTAELLQNYLSERTLFEEESIFDISDRAVQQAFKKASKTLGIDIIPHLLRTIFSEKCARAGIKDKYIDAFCGRISHGMLAKHYTDYSPSKLREEYDKVEPLLALE